MTGIWEEPGAQSSLMEGFGRTREWGTEEMGNFTNRPCAFDGVLGSE